MEWVLDRNEVFMAHILAIDDDPGILALIEHAVLWLTFSQLTMIPASSR